MSHKCPGPSCSRMVAGHMLMCRVHWYQVPPGLRSEVWDAWRGGAGAGTAEHREAILAAIKSIGGKA